MYNLHAGNDMPVLQMQDVEAAQLPYLYFTGEDSQANILFVHATGFVPWLWQPIIKKFHPSNNSWAPFICNYRQCDPEKGGLNWDTIARDLAKFCHALKINSPLVVGHSMGATVLTLACALYGLEPRAMVLIEPIFLPEYFYETKIKVKDHPLASKAIKRTNNWHNEEEAWAYLKSKPLFKDWDDEVLSLYLKYGMTKQEGGSLKLTCTPESEASLFMGGWSSNPWRTLGKLNCPVLLVEGEKSDNKKFVDMNKMLSLLKHGQYKMIAGAGHLIPMQKPDDIARIIKEFSSQTGNRNSL
jgi:pimeloyl-ACP methyl ester carboxylesterase